MNTIKSVVVAALSLVALNSVSAAETTANGQWFIERIEIPAGDACGISYPASTATLWWSSLPGLGAGFHVVDDAALPVLAPHWPRSARDRRRLGA